VMQSVAPFGADVEVACHSQLPRESHAVDASLRPDRLVRRGERRAREVALRGV